MSHRGEERVDTSSSEAQAATDRNNQQARDKGTGGRDTEKILKKKAKKDRRKQGTGAWRQETGLVMDLISNRAPAVTQLIASRACGTIVNSSRSVMIWNSGVQDSGFNPLRGTALLMHECV